MKIGTFDGFGSLRLQIFSGWDQLNKINRAIFFLGGRFKFLFRRNGDKNTIQWMSSLTEGAKGKQEITHIFDLFTNKM